MNKLIHGGTLVLIGGGGILIFIFSLMFIFSKKDIPVVTNDYYAEEQKFNDLQLARQRGDALGPQFSVEKQDEKIIMTIPAELSLLLREGYIYVYDVASSLGDLKTALHPNTSGIYQISVPTNHRNLVVKCFFTVNHQSYFKEIKI